MAEAYSVPFQVPSMGLGTGLTDRFDDVETAVEYAVDSGYRFFDCAWSTGTEKRVGRAIRKKLDENIIKRSDLFISTKLSNFHHSREVVKYWMKKSMLNLQLHYLDLYIMEWPMAQELSRPHNDRAFRFTMTDYIETWHAMEDCFEAGLTRGIGVANFNSVQIERLMRYARYKPLVNQIELHPYFLQKKLLNLCRERGIHVIAYHPVGIIEEPLPYFKFVPYSIDEEVIHKIARKWGKTSQQVVYKYLISHLGVSVIHTTVYHPKISSDLQYHDIVLEEADIQAIESLDRNKRVNTASMYEAHMHYPFGLEY